MPHAPRYIETLPRRGYRFLMRVDVPARAAAARVGAAAHRAAVPDDAAGPRDRVSGLQPTRSDHDLALGSRIARRPVERRRVAIRGRYSRSPARWPAEADVDVMLTGSVLAIRRSTSRQHAADGSASRHARLGAHAADVDWRRLPGAGRARAPDCRVAVGAPDGAREPRVLARRSVQRDVCTSAICAATSSATTRSGGCVARDLYLCVGPRRSAVRARLGAAWGACITSWANISMRARPTTSSAPRLRSSARSS